MEGMHLAKYLFIQQALFNPRTYMSRRSRVRIPLLPSIVHHEAPAKLRENDYSVPLGHMKIENFKIKVSSKERFCTDLFFPLI